MEYILKLSAILSIFYFFYKLFLQNETFFQSIRIYFLVGIFISFLLPLVSVAKYIQSRPIALSVSDIVSEQAMTQTETINGLQILLIVYFVGLFIFTIRLLVQISSLLWFLYTSSKTKKGKYIFIKTSDSVSPFSFFNYIVYNESDFNTQELDQILVHEKTHTDHVHSIDNLLSQIVLIINWFNPIIWLYHKEILKNLEFIADDMAQGITQEKNKYQYLLLKTNTRNYQMKIANSFYNSIIKKRIDMLEKNRSKKTFQLKFVLIIPVLVAFVFTFNTEIIAQQNQVPDMEIQTDYQIEVISKDFQKNDLENLRDDLATQGITFKFKKLKYNAKNEITGINISVKNKNGNQANLSQSSGIPIKPIQIKFNNNDGTLALGNIEETQELNNVFVSSGNNGKMEKIIVKNDGDRMIVFISDSLKTKNAGEDGAIFVSDDGSQEKIIIHIDDEKDLQFGTKGDKNINVWVSSEGNSIHKEKMNLSMGGDYKYKTIHLETDDDDIIVGNRIASDKSKAMVFISDNENPLIILDGKELKNGKVEDIDPEIIENIQVLKGEAVKEKYGDKAKDGVIIIKTKK